MIKTLMRALTLAALSLASASLSAQTVSTPERLVWQDRPLSLTLVVGKETHLSVPSNLQNVQVGIPQSIFGSLKEQHLQGHIYLQATKKFDSTRLHIRSTNNEAYYLIDVKAIEKGVAPNEVELVDPGSAPAATKNQEDAILTTSVPPSAFSSRNSDPPEIALTRYMARQFYGPLRLATPLADASRIALKADSKLVPLITTMDVDTRPVAAWSYRGINGLAVRLVNHSNHEVVVDPRTFRGEWIMATTQHALLSAASSQAATQYGTNETTVYLISREPIQSVLSDLPAVDPGKKGG